MSVSERLTDLDELVLKCLPGPSKSYASEAVATYRAGAYRAAIVTIWIAVLYDLIDKLRDLALYGNTEAKLKIEEFDKWQTEIAAGNRAVFAHSLKFEREVLTYVRDKFQLVDGQQFIDLSRLQEDRNRSAHPTLQKDGIPFQPNAEVARSHLCNAMLGLLHQPAVQGRSALAEVRRTVTSAYFPEKIDDVNEVLSSGVMANPSDALVRGAIDELMFGVVKLGDSYHRLGKAIRAVAAIAENYRSIAETRIAINIKKIANAIDDKEIAALTAMVVGIPDARRALEKIHLNKIRSYLTSGPEAEFVRFAGLVHKIDELKDCAIDRLKTLGRESLVKLVESADRSLAIPASVDLYCKSRGWQEANGIAESLVLPLLPLMDKGQIVRIIESPKKENADLIGSHGFNDLLRQIRQEALIPVDELDEILKVNSLARYIPSDDEIM